MKQVLSFALCALLLLSGCSSDINQQQNETEISNDVSSVTQYSEAFETYSSLNVSIAVPKSSIKQVQSKHLTKPLGTHEDIVQVTLKVLNEKGEILAQDIELNYSNGAYTGTITALPLNERLTLSARAVNEGGVEIFAGEQETVLIDEESNSVSLTMVVLDDGKDITIPRLTKIVLDDEKMHFYVDDNGSTGTLEYILESTDLSLNYVQTEDTVVLDESGAHVISVDYNASEYGTFVSNFTILNTLGGKLSTSFSSTFFDNDGEGNFSVSLAPVISGIHVIRNGEDLIVEADVSDDSATEALHFAWRFEPIYDGGIDQSFVDNSDNPATLQGYNANMIGYLYINVTDPDGASSETRFTIRQNQFPDFTPPRILHTSPNHEATGITVNSTISVTFDEVMQNVTNETIMITPDVTFSVESGDNKTFIIRADRAFSYDEEYFITFTNALTDSSENTLVAKTISFTTQTNPDDENHAPIATYKGFNTTVNSDYNGTLTATDADGDVLTYSLVSTCAHGSLNINSDGTFSYSPATHYVGADSFIYKVNDGQIDSVDQNVTITIGETTTTHELPLLIIRVEFNDFKFHNDAATWSNKIFADAEGSLSDYYKEVSYGEFTFTQADEIDETENDGVITIQFNIDHPGNRTGFGFWPYAMEAINMADASMDFAQYDTNGDAKLSRDEFQVMFLMAGGESAYGNAPGFWAHASCLWTGAAPIVDGVSVMECSSEEDGGSYSVFGERHDDHDATIGVMAHELGHAALKLPDLYDTSNSSSGIGYFGLMGSGAWSARIGNSFRGESPSHLCAWSKEKLGWGEVTEVSSGVNSFTLKGTALSDYSMLKIPTENPNEYFLIENRAREGYDRGLIITTGGFDGGIAIWHIDNNVGTGNANKDHKQVDLEEMNNIGLDSKIHRGHANNLMYAGNSDNFTPSTEPNSNLYSGATSGIHITNPSDVGSIMRVDIER
jgi:M6 family metalloprotease-like protein